MSLKMNCNAANRYQVDIRVPNTLGNLAAPSAAGQLANIKLRFSATKNGAAIHANVGNLATTETSGKVGRLYHELSQALHQTHLLPLGDGASYFAIWSLASTFDIESVEFIVGTGVFQ